LLAACTVITGDLGRTIAIEIDGAMERSVEENDTITLVARALSAAGDTVADATIVWEILSPDSGDPAIGFDLDGSTGIVQANFPSRGRVRARVDELLSDTIAVIVTGAPDSIGVAGDSVITVASDADVSPPMTVVLIDLTTDSALASPLEDKEVTFALAAPLPGSPEAQGLILTVSDTTPGEDPHTLTVTTNSSSQASVVARRVADSSLPDSAVVNAFAVTAVGDTVAGSPARFVLVFETTP
jgi:hypothetical protein